MNNRILAMLLAIIMLISIVPVTALAAEHTCVDDNNNGTCDVSGCVLHVHKAADVLSKDDSGHFYRCKFAECSNAKLTETEAHNYTTCIPAGGINHQGTCEDCGYQKLLAHVDNDKDCKCDECDQPLKHDLEVIEAVAKTCTTDGILKHAKCKVCGALYTYDGTTAITEAHIIDKAPEHSAYSKWLSDETGHWHMCRNEDLQCEEKLEFAAHTPSEWRLYPSDKSKHIQQCTVCSLTLSREAHNYVYTAKDYGTDTHKIECADCNMEASVQSCVDADGDCKCDKCNALMAGVHAAGLTYVKKVEPKCEVTGVDSHYKCEDCGTLFGNSTGTTIVTLEDLTIDALKHVLSGWESDKDGHWKDCIRAGCPAKLECAEHTPGDCRQYPSDTTKHFQQCTVCVRSLNIEAHEYEPKAKDYGAGTHTVTCKDCGVASAQTCVDGNKDCKCDICGVLMGHARAGLTYHAYKAATCLEDGSHGYMSCDTCGNTFENQKGTHGFYIPGSDFVIEALGHKWESVGETLKGKHQQQCAHCGLFRAVPHEDTDGDCDCDVNDCGIIVHSHKLMVIDRKAPTCTTAGSESYMQYEGCGKMFDLDRKPIAAPVAIAALGHDWSADWTAYDADNHAKKCARCDEMQYEAHKDANKDNYCDVCEVALALTYVPQQDPTCTNIGYEGYWVSEITGRKYSDEAGTTQIINPAKIPALGHNLGEAVTNGATSHVYSCSRCSYTKTEAHTNKVNKCLCDICGEVISGHQIEYVEGEPATCTKPGTKDYVICDCGAMRDAESGAEITAPIVIPALGHEYESEWYNDTREGAHSKDCQRDGCSVKISEAHKLTAEDLLTGNLHEWHCSVCDYQKTEIHADSNGDSICDECGHGSNKAVDAGDLNNPSETVTIKGDAGTTTQEKQNTWWKSFIGKLNPSYVGESASSSAPSASVEGDLSDGSGVSSGSTSGAGQNTTTAPSSTTLGAVVEFLMGLLNTLFGI